MRTTITQRKKMKKLFEQGKAIQDIMSIMNVSYFQVYNVLSGRIKSKYGHRSDKGAKHKKFSLDKTFEEFNSAEDYLQYQLIETMRQLDKVTLAPHDRVRIVKDATTTLNKIKVYQLENYIRRPDAVLIARIMRRFNPELTDENIIHIYREESEKMERESK